MKIWLDDVRPPPDESWTWAHTSDEAIALLRYTPREVEIEEVSLDHDLGLYDTGLRVARYIADMITPPTTVRIHSMNPVGAEAMRRALEPPQSREDA